MASLRSGITYAMKANAFSDFTLRFPQQVVEGFAQSWCSGCVERKSKGLKTASAYSKGQQAYTLRKKLHAYLPGNLICKSFAFIGETVP